MAEGSLIETGVDKLVAIVRKKKKISVTDAARLLGVSTVVVEEWADFLEDEGIISIEYKFTTPYLVERLFTREEIEKKEKEFGGKKEAFVRKAEVTLALLDREGSSFQKIREQFDELKKDLGSEIKHVKGDLQELEKYEELKNNIDTKIENQKKEYRESIRQIEDQVTREEKRYSDVLEKINDEGKKIDKEKMMALSIREREELLREKLDGFRDMIDKLEESLESEDKLVIDSEEHISRLKELADEIKESVESKKASLDNLFDESKKQEMKIMALQDSILVKAKDKKEQIEKRIAEGKGASLQFKTFFDKKGKVEETLKKISEHRNELEKELIQLIHKAKAFSMAAKTTGTAPHIKELKKTFGNIDKKKGIFEKELRGLASLLKK